MAESSSIVLCHPRTADREVIAIAGFLAGYSARTRRCTRSISASSTGGARTCASSCSGAPPQANRSAERWSACTWPTSSSASAYRHSGRFAPTGG